MSANSEASLQGMRVKVEYRLNQVEVGTSTIYRLQYIYRRGSGQASMVQGKVTEVELGVGPMGETQEKGRGNPRVVTRRLALTRLRSTLETTDLFHK